MDPLSEEFEHETLAVFRDPATGVTGAIAIHSTVLGPAMGGLRLFRYRDLNEALLDALRLARAMSFKSAAAGLDLGGGKAVLLDDGGWDEARGERMRAVGAAIGSLAGRYITAEDVGTTPADMDAIAEVTGHVAGGTASNGGSGDPSPYTARTVFEAIEAAVRIRLGRDSLAAVSVGVQGVGHVGASLVESLTAAGATVYVTDVDTHRCTDLAQRLGATVLPLDGFVYGDFDVLAPCALGATITPADAPRLRASIVAGAANNPLSHRDAAASLAAAGVLYVPDFIANCGGIVHVGAEALGLAQAEVDDLLTAAGTRTEQILLEAAESNRLPLEIAEQHALERLSRRPQPATS
jgi:glutamate dehydrogenase/leucine dehydrogenase